MSMKLTYKVSGIKGSVVYTDFQPETEFVVFADKIYSGTDKIRRFLADNFLKADSVVLVKIEDIK